MRLWGGLNWEEINFQEIPFCYRITFRSQDCLSLSSTVTQRTLDTQFWGREGEVQAKEAEEQERNQEGIKAEKMEAKARKQISL
jgi:hypothetical protein